MNKLNCLRHSVVLIWIAFVISMNSCAKYTVISQNSLPDSDINGQDSQKENVSVYFWGLFSSPTYSTGTCPSGSFHKVEVKSNFLQTAVGVVTLGLVRPMTVECFCAKKDDFN